MGVQSKPVCDWSADHLSFYYLSESAAGTECIQYCFDYVITRVKLSFHCNMWFIA